MKKRSVSALALFFLILGMISLRNFPEFVEKGYSQTFYPLICRLLRPVFNIIPFSAGDLFYIALIVYILIGFIRSVGLIISGRFKDLLRGLLGFMIKAELAVIVFYVFWGINYFRLPASQRLSLPDSAYTAADLRSVTAMLIDSANYCRQSLNRSDLGQDDGHIFNIAEAAVHQLNDSLGDLHNYHLHIKPSLLSTLLNYTATAGYYNPFTGESQLNCRMPVFLRPVIACHEMAHQSGYSAEDEANFIGFRAGISSKNKLLRYSAYYLGVDEFMHQLWRRDSTAHKEMKARLSVLVLDDFKTDRDYWTRYQGKAGELSSILYDRYLKANNQPAGMRTYNRMIRLAVAYYRQTAFLPSVYKKSR